MPPVTIERSSAPRVQVGGRELIAFAGCDYLGLAHAPEVLEAARAGLERYGLSAGASRATTGNADAHDALEHDLARFLGLEAAVLVPAGYLSAQVFLQGIAHRTPLALVDREVHVSTLDALAANGVRSRTFAFCDADSAQIERAQIECAQLAGPIAIMTDGVYPVMRAVAPLPQLLELVSRDGWLVVDDCHGTGVLGARGRGSHEHHGIADERLIVTGTLSKALGSFGGFVAGPRAVLDEVRARSRAFVGSTPIPPALALAGSAAIQLIERDPTRLQRLRRNTHRVRVVLRAAGIDCHDLPVPVFAWKSGPERSGDRVHEVLADHGVLVPHVCYADGLGSYFRLAVTALHDEGSIARLGSALHAALETT